MVELEPSLAKPTLPSESDENIGHVCFFSLYLLIEGGIPLMAPLPSPEVCSFDWNGLVEPLLPSYVPFHTTVKVLYASVHRIVIDEGASIRILSSTAWKVLGSPNLLPFLS